MDGFIHVSQLDRSRVDHPSTQLKTGDKLTAEITKFDVENGKVLLSRRQWLKRQEKKVLSSYMRPSSGGVNSMGELLAEIKLDDDLPTGE